MFSSFSNVLRLPNLPTRRAIIAIDLPPVDIHQVETSSERRARSLKHFIRANHIQHSIIYHNLQFHNHTPHILGSAYILGAEENQLKTIYESEGSHQEPWTDSPGEISEHDWRDYLGKRNYQRAFIDFFEDQLVAVGYDWKQLLERYLYEGKDPLINGLIGGCMSEGSRADVNTLTNLSVGHPLIHLGYAYELDSQTIAIESLGLGACFYNDLHKYMDDPSYTRPASYKSSSVLEVLQRVASDTAFDNLFDHPGGDNIENLLKKHEDAVLDHWNSWEVQNPKAQFEESQQAAVALVVATHIPSKQYDFFLLHVLTTSHAVRILLPIIPAKLQLALVRQWWFLALVAYIAQLRSDVDLGRINDYDLQGRDWRFVIDKAVNGPHAQDPHFVKGLRAMQNAEETWRDSSDYYVKAAVKLASEFDGWGGFAPEEIAETELKT